MRTALLLVALSSSTALAAVPVGDPLDPGGGTIGPLDAAASCQANISAKYNVLARRGINLGAQVGTLQIVGRNDWCYQAFEFGRIHTDPYAVSTAAITGAVLSKYLALGAEGGLGRTVVDAASDGLATQQHFVGGSIIVHPSFGTRAIHNPLAALWRGTGAQARFGYPITDQIANPFGIGASSRLERGYVARTDDMGAWIDFTGAGEGRVSAALQLYRDAAMLGTTLSRSLSGESPVALRPQLGTLDNLTSSLSLTMPTRTSLYLYDLSPLEGRYMRITGADNSLIRVSNIGTWMNDRTSSMMLVNHGTVSSRSTIASLAVEIQTALDPMPVDDLLHDALASQGATGSLTWNSPVTVTLIPGERLIQFTRKAYLNVNADWGIDGDGDVLFTVAVRPYVAWIPDSANPGMMRPSVHAWFVEGSAISISCSGWACSSREEALASLFDSVAVRGEIERAFDQAFDLKVQALRPLEVLCSGLGVRRVNVLPDALEVVVGDTAAQAACAAPAGSQLDFARPVARITNHGYTAGVFPVPAPSFDGTVTVIPFLDPGPIVVK